MTLDQQAAEAARLWSRGDFPGAERVLRAILAVDPAYLRAAEPLAGLLVATGRPAEALAVTGPIIAGCDHVPVIISHIDALRDTGRPEEALPFMIRLAGQLPSDGMVQQQLAAVLAEVGRFEEALAVLTLLRQAGFDHPFTWLIEASALRELNRLDEAEAACSEAVRRAPDMPEAQKALSDLVWMRTGDTAAATRELDLAIAAYPQVGPLRQTKARLLQNAGDERGAYRALATGPAGSPGDPALEATASQMAVTFDPALALDHARRALANAPTDVTIVSICAEACLAAGEPEEALRLAERMRALAPLNQHGVALMATAWRLLGDPRYGQLYDYDRFVRPMRLETPDGWDNLDAWMVDLRASLHALHGAQAHPVGQSLRGGSQTQQRLDRSSDPAVRAFFQAIDGPVRRYIAELGQGDDPLRSRNTGDYAVSGSWSVRLRPGGRHVSHLHPGGWLSSASYLELPDAIGAGGREGWLGFGEPGIPTAPPLATEHWIRPEPGMLVLFPSYMWHGTAPFGGDQTRLTAAFDVVPA